MVCCLFVSCCICFFFFFFLILHGVCIVGIMDYILVGGLIPLFMLPPPLFLFPIVLMKHIPIFFFLLIMFCMPIPLFTYAPGFPFALLCVFSPHLDENFWGGVCICILSYAAICGF